jgi:hypothetical protein
MGIAYNTSIVSDGLVYALDAANSRCYSGSGNTANGLLGGINGTLTNGTGYSSVNSGSFFFDGTNDFISFNAYTPEANTISIWVKINSLQQGVVIYVGDDIFNSGLWSWFFLVINNSFYVRANPGSYTTAFNDNPQIGQWINYTLVRRNSSNLSDFYKNGVLIGTSANSTLSNTYSNLKIGYGGGSFPFFNLSQVLIYNRALTAQEIRQNYNATKKRYI